MDKQNERMKSGASESGIVVSWNKKNGVGFIRPDVGNEDLLASYKDIHERGIGMKHLFQGQRVYFNREKTEKGYKAVHIKFDKYRIRKYDKE